MGPAFDPYHKWLGIPPEDQPPHHYRLLGIKEFEADPDVIQAAADQRMAHLRTYQTSRHADWSQRLLNEVAAAKICLLTPAKRAAYDEQLRETMRPPEPEASRELPFTIVVDEPPRPTISRSSRAKTRKFPTLIGVGAALMGVVVIVALVYRVTEPRNVSGLFKGPLEQRLDRHPPDTGQPQNDPSLKDAKPVEAVRPKKDTASTRNRGDTVGKKKTPIPALPKSADAAPTRPVAKPMPENGARLNIGGEPSLHDLGEPSVARAQPPAKSIEPKKPEKPAEEPSKTKPKPGVPALKPGSPIRFGRWFPLLPSPNELTGWEVARARCVYLNRIIELRGGEMYYPVVVKDATIRAKINRRDTSSIRLIVRNCDQGCYFVQLSTSSWSIIKATRNMRDASQGPGWKHRWDKEDILGTLAVKRNIPNVVLEMGLAVAGNTLTVFFNRQPILQARDTAFSEGMVGIAASDGNGVFISDVEMLMSKGSFVADHRVMKP